MNKNRIFNEKGITLIALVVSIIVLLILAGVSIAVLTGENGLINRATSAKQTHEEKTAEEELRLGVSALTIDYRKNTTNATSFRDYVMANTQALANAMGVDANELSMDTDNYSVTYKGQTYTITDDGKLEPFVLVPLTAFSIVEESLEVAEGETKKLTIQKTPSNANERIVWTSSDNTIATVDENGNVTGVKNGTQTATISAVSKSGNVSSSTSCVVTVTKSLGYFKTIVTNQTTGDGVAYYFSSPSATTGTPIDANNMGQFLGMKVNYTAGGYLTIGSKTVGQGANYRVFYIDVGGKFGTEGTIYLKAEEDSNYAALNGIAHPQVSDIATNFNREWSQSTYASSPAENMTYVNKLLNKNIWSVYKDTAGIANYVVGAPDLEMWVDSYNIFLATYPVKDSNNQDLYFSFNYTVLQDTTNGPTGKNNGHGYYVGYNNEYNNYNGYNTALNKMVNPTIYMNNSNLIAADRVIVLNNGSNSFWLASPSAASADGVIFVNGAGRVDLQRI